MNRPHYFENFLFAPFSASFRVASCPTYLYRASLGCANFDSARHSQIEAKRSERARPLLNSKASKAAETREGPEAAKTREGPVDLRSAKQVNVVNRAERFRKVAASQNSHNLSGHGISMYFKATLKSAKKFIKNQFFQNSGVGS